MAFYGRGKNKIKDPYTLVDIYESYKEYVKDNPVYNTDYRDFRIICSLFNKRIIEHILYKSETFKMFGGIGELSVLKLIPSKSKTKRLSVDFKKTSEYGKTIFHTNDHSDGYKYMFHWNKSKTIFRNKYLYNFIPTRANKRTLAKIIKNKECDYFDK